MTEAKDWIKEQLKKGVPPSQIRESLVRNGWNPYVAENMIDEVNGSGKLSTGKDAIFSYNVIISLAVVAIVGMVLVYFVFFYADSMDTGPMENTNTETGNDGGGSSESGGGGSANSINLMTVTARQLTQSMFVSSNEEEFVVDYLIFDDGESFAIEDTIDKVLYNTTNDATTIVFEWMEDSPDMGEIRKSYNPIFNGDLRDSYSMGDEVRIELTIEEVEFSADGMNYRIDTFEEKIFEIDGLNAEKLSNAKLPQSCISKI